MRTPNTTSPSLSVVPCVWDIESQKFVPSYSHRGAEICSEHAVQFTAVRADEREACAKVADDFDDDPILGADIAAAIRARKP